MCIVGLYSTNFIVILINYSSPSTQNAERKSKMYLETTSIKVIDISQFYNEIMS